MIDFNQLDIMAIIGAGFASFFLGFVWYSMLFSKQWMSALGINREDVDGSGLSIAKAIFGSLVSSFLTAIGMAVLLHLTSTTVIQQGVFLAIFVWIAFSMGPTFKMIFWEDRPVTLFLIDGGYEFVSIMATTIIIMNLS